MRTTWSAKLVDDWRHAIFTDGAGALFHLEVGGEIQQIAYAVGGTGNEIADSGRCPVASPESVLPAAAAAGTRSERLRCALKNHFGRCAMKDVGAILLCLLGGFRAVRVEKRAKYLHELALRIRIVFELRDEPLQCIAMRSSSPGSSKSGAARSIAARIADSEAFCQRDRPPMWLRPLTLLCAAGWVMSSSNFFDGQITPTMATLRWEIAGIVCRHVDEILEELGVKRLGRIAVVVPAVRDDDQVGRAGRDLSARR